MGSGPWQQKWVGEEALLRRCVPQDVGDAGRTSAGWQGA